MPRRNKTRTGSKARRGHHRTRYRSRRTHYTRRRSYRGGMPKYTGPTNWDEMAKTLKKRKASRRYKPKQTEREKADLEADLEEVGSIARIRSPRERSRQLKDMAESGLTMLPRINFPYKKLRNQIEVSRQAFQLTLGSKDLVDELFKLLNQLVILNKQGRSGSREAKHAREKISIMLKYATGVLDIRNGAVVTDLIHYESVLDRHFNSSTQGVGQDKDQIIRALLLARIARAVEKQENLKSGDMDKLANKVQKNNRSIYEHKFKNVMGLLTPLDMLATADTYAANRKRLGATTMAMFKQHKEASELDRAGSLLQEPQHKAARELLEKFGDRSF